MNTINEFDELLTAWLADEAPATEPDGLALVALARTRRTRQVASTGLLERWLPMELTFRRPMLAMPTRLLAILLALMLLLIAAMSVPLLLGERSLPAMVASEWRNGLIAYARVGDIWVVDPQVGEPQVLIGGMTADDEPGWSPDGTRIAFVRDVGGKAALMVADADGTDIREVMRDPLPSIDWYAWSPDGTRLAVESAGRVGTVSIGDGPDDGILETVPIDRSLSMPSWHPEGTSFLVRAETPDGTGLFPVSFPGRAIGRSIRKSDTTSPLYAGDRGRSDLMEAAYSPDGSRIAYLQGQLATDGRYGVFGGPDTRNHVMDADGTNDQVIEFSPTSDYEDGASFSPDGTRLSMVIREGDFHQIAVMTLDGSRLPVATEPEEDPNAMPAIWSPDGRQILAVRIADGVSYLIDPDTGVKTMQPWLANWADWQRLPVAP